MRPLLLAVAVLAVLAAPAEAVDIITVSQNTSTQSQMQTGRVFRDGVPSSCDTQKLPPTLANPASTFRYVNHTFRSRLTGEACIEVDLESACTDLFSVAYTSPFDPANPLAGYAGDMGTSSGYPAFSFAVPPEGFFGVVVHETPTTSCGPYTVTFRSRGPWAEATPRIAGDPSLGSVLTGTDADWVATPAIQRRWQRCDATGAGCTDIPGATEATYTVTPADVGSTLRFFNAATDADATHGSQSAFVEPYIPFEVREGESLGAGDRVQQGFFVRNGLESRCNAPTTAPAVLQPADTFLYDAFAVRSILNEPVCMVARTDPDCLGGVSPAVYNPVFAPAAGLAVNYAANSGVPFNSDAAVSAILPAGEGREVTVSHGPGGPCAAFGVVLGADAPFATARPALSGEPVEGGTVTASEGTWSGSPAFARSWLRCDAGGGACAPVPGATGSSYTPTTADVGARLRARVTATQGRSVSSDSEPSGVVAAAPRDVTPPRGSVRLGSRNLRRAVRSGRVPVRVRCNEACTAVVRLRVTRKLARRLKLRRKVVIASVRGAVPAGRTVTLRARLTRRARRALRTRRSLKLRVTATLADAGGNRTAVGRRAALRRPRR